ncbi:MAG: carbohydrate ABC transporter substrate-binding protein, partial [Clostridia bacterium]|nr:carbohydrate ABC transporter substrate-binding protein [Clostridia bacterium]
MKKLVSLLLALTMIVSCTAALAAEDGKITIWTWDPNFNIAAMKVAKEMYATINPGVEVVIEEVLSEDIETRVITAASAGDLSNLPDIMLCQDNSFQKMVMNYPEVYTNLTGKYDYEGFPAGKLAYSIIDGQNYGIPFDAGTVVATYRTDLLEQAGYTIADLTDI